ncbi:VCBS domain-containing protein [Planktomarina sp.]|nr:VCBS domain-containing protein [Planktomarina sp.]MDA9100684.1 VCBS domain-containing protein [Planktomarina sp.]
MSRKNKFFVGVSPLGLLALSACGGGSSTSSPSVSYTATSGFAQSGPLNNATVFLDYNQDGIFTSGTDSPKVFTDVDGKWEITPTSGTYNIVVTTTLDQFGASSTTDSTIGGVVENITLIAPSGAGNAFNGANVMVTPATTMIANLMALDSSLTASDAKDNVAKALGFTQAEITAGFDPLTFNAFDPLRSGDAYEALALKAELTSKKIMTVVNTLASAVEGSGGSQSDAFTAAMNSVAGVLNVKITNMSDATKTAAEKVLDFNVDTDIEAITAALSTEVAGMTGASKTAFDSVSTAVNGAIFNVVDGINTISKIDETQSVFQTISLVSDQVKAATQNATLNLSDANLYVGQDPDGISVAAQVANNALLVIGGALATGGSVTNTVAQQVTIKSSGDDSGISFYIIGKDASGADLVVTLTGANAKTATTTEKFLIVSSITAIGDPAGTVMAGVQGILSKVTTDDDGISTSAAVANDATLAFNGVLVDSVTGNVTNAAAVKITIKSSGDDSGITFDLVGTDASGAVLTETVTGANSATATSTGSFKTIASITADGDPAGNVSAGIVGNFADDTVALSDEAAFIALRDNNAPTDISGTSSYLESDTSLIVGTLAASDTDQSVTDVDGISVSAAVANNASLVIGGALHVSNSVTNKVAQKVTITSVGNDSGISFTVIGTDASGAVLTETVTGANSGTATSAGSFKTITSITAVGDPVGNVSAGVLGNSHTFTLMTGGDFASFTLTDEGVLKFKTQPDYEAKVDGVAKTTYDIKVMATDELGKTYIEDLQISVTNANEPAVITAVVAGSVTEDSTQYTLTGTVSAIDPEGQAVTYSASSLNGSYGGTLTINASTGAYTYTMDNENVSVQDLQGSETLTETFTILASDGEAQGSGSLSFTINGADDVFLTPPLTSDVDGISVAAAVANNGALVLGGALASSGSVTNAVARKVIITSAGDDSADADCISVAASVTGNTALVIGGAMASGGSVTHTAAEKVTITSAGDDSGITFTVVGTDAAGAALTEVVTGANAAAATSSGSFLTVTSITASASTAGNVSAGSPAIEFTIVGTDANGAALTETVTGTNAGTVTSSNAFLTVASITAVGDPAGNVTAGALGHTLTEGDTATITGTLSGSDPLSGALNYSISGSIVADGSYAATGTYGSLTVNATTGAYVYTLDNTDADTNGIAKDAVLTETFKVRVDNGTQRSTKDLNIEITGINDDPVLTAPTGGTTTEGGTSTASSSLTVADPDSGESASATFAITGGTVSSGSSILTGTYGSLALNVTSGAYTYTLDQTDADTVALTAADSKTETFTVTATDVNGASGSATLSIAVVGTGITVNPIATDDKVNKAEETAGFNITGRGTVNQTVTLSFNSSLADKTTTVDANGNWSVAIVEADINTMGEGGETVTAVIGSDSSGAKAFAVDTVIPTTAITAVKYNIEADADGISVAAAVGNNAALVLGGVLASGGSVTNSLAQKITISSTGNDSGIEFTVVGTNAAGAALTETVTGANADTATSIGSFLTVSSVTAVGNPAGNVSVGTEAKQLVLTGTNFNTLGATGADVKSQIDWTKLVWDINGDAGDPGVTFALADIASAIITSATVLTVQLTGAKAAALEGTSGFAAAGSTDNVDIAVGFSVDGSGNVATTDVLANVNPSYSDDVRPTVTKFSSTTADGSYNLNDTINITATLSEVVLSTAEITVTLNDTGATTVLLTTSSNSNTLSGTYTVPANATASDLSVNSYVVTTAVSDPYGNTLQSTALPSGENLADNQNFSIDTSVPTNTISSVQYNSTDKTIVITGTGMTTIEAAGTDVKSVLDWTKLNWDLDGDDAATAGKTFVLADIDSAIVTSATVLTVKLTAAAAIALEATVGFAADGLGSSDTADTIDVVAGFSVDLAGNPATTDAAANLSPTYSDGTKPSVTSFTSTTANGSYKEGDAVNITANMSEVVLGGGSITATLSTGDTVVLSTTANSAALTGSYSVPASRTSTDLSVSSFVVTSAVKDLYAGNTLSDTSLPSSIAADPDGISVAAAVGNNGSLTIAGALASGGSVTNAVAQKVTILSAGNDSAIKFTVVGTDATGTAVTETVTGANDGTATSIGLFKTITSIAAVGDPAGNVSAGTAVNAQNLADNKDIVIDTTVPTSTITGISYGKNATTDAREIIITGTKFNTLAATDTDVKSSLDWSKFVWDLDASSSDAGVTFAASDFASAVVTSATTLTATLTSDKATSLEATNGFAQDGLGSTPAADNIDVAAGFVVDLAGNVATTDAAANIAPTYSDGTAPTVTKFTSTSQDGGYTVDDLINITATVSETIIEGGQITVTLDTGDSVDLTAASNGTTLSGNYTVGAGKTSADLAVNSFSVKTAITDLYNNSMTDVTVPGSQNLSDNSAIVIDTAGPTNTITGVSYDNAAKNITLAGTSFSTIAAVNSDVKTAVDWSKFVWDLDGDGVGSGKNAGITFSSGDITSAIITSATVMTITLTDAKAADLVATTGFAADGLGSTDTDDNIDITAGFSRDTSGNAATTDGGASLVPTYSDTTKPTITSFTSTTADGGYGAPKQDINITATASETVLAGSSINVTLDTGDVVALTAATNGTTLVGTYDPTTGDTSSDLTVSSYAVGSAGVTDTYGNTLTATALPTGQNLGDSSAIFIDTSKPTSTITAVAYNNTGGKISLTGTNMTSLGTAGTDVKANLDWTKLKWDLDASASDPGVSFQLSDITSATVTNATTLIIDLTAAKQASLEGTTGFGAGGLDAGTFVGDNIDISEGFTRDAVLNASTDDAAANKAPTYADSVKPTVSNFTSTTTDGSYKSGDTINITATMSESILAGSKMTVTLSTTDLVTLTAGQNGTTLAGPYTVSAADVSSDLAVSSYSLTDAAGTTNAVIDAFGNAMSATTLPAGQNLSDNKALIVDNTALFTNATVALNGSHAAGDAFALTFNEAVGNTAVLSGTVAANATLGTTAATSVWSNSNKTMTVTLGAGESLNADLALVFASVLDLAGNEATSVTYTLDIV